MSEYYDHIDDLTYDQLKEHCRKHQLNVNITDDIADQVFRKAWEDGHAYGHHEVASHYVDISELVNATWLAAKESK